MGVGASVQWNGDALVGELRKRLKRALDVGAELIVSEAKLRCPVDTGTLRRSIDWGEGRDENERIVGTPVEYGLYQEVGYLAGGKTFVQNPYLLPAIMDNQDALAQIILRHLGAEA